MPKPNIIVQMGKQDKKDARKTHEAVVRAFQKPDTKQPAKGKQR